MKFWEYSLCFMFKRHGYRVHANRYRRRMIYLLSSCWIGCALRSPASWGSQYQMTPNFYTGNAADPPGPCVMWAVKWNVYVPHFTVAHDRGVTDEEPNWKLGHTTGSGLRDNATDKEEMKCSGWSINSQQSTHSDHDSSKPNLLLMIMKSSILHTSILIISWAERK